MKKIIVSLVALVVALGASADAAMDLTSSITSLGFPSMELGMVSSDLGSYTNLPYARNVWDLKVFEGRLYAGSGNSGNSPSPNPNAGPVYIMSYDFLTQKWVNELATDRMQQIDIFRILDDGNLYIPGHDLRAKYSCLYVRNKNATGSSPWRYYQLADDASSHAYDVTMFDDRIVACGYKIWLSTNETPANVSTITSSATLRKFAFFNFADNLYAPGEVTNGNAVTVAHLAKGSTNFTSSVMTHSAIYPDHTVQAGDPKMYPQRSVSFNSRVLYIAGFRQNDHQILPTDLYTATDGESTFTASRVSLASGAVPWDLEVINGAVYLLWTTANGDKFNNHISVSTDGETFSELFCFTTDTFARSFDYHDGNFYFGLGTENADIFNPRNGKNDALIHADSGKVLSVPYDLTPTAKPVIDDVVVSDVWTNTLTVAVRGSGLKTGSISVTLTDSQNQSTAAQIISSFGGSCTFTSLTPGETYTVVVSATNDNGTTTDDSVSVKTYGCTTVAPRANYDDSSNTLTFTCDNIDRSAYCTVYEVGAGSGSVWAASIKTTLAQVVFDSSFGAAKPTSLASWFDGCKALVSIT